MMEGESRYAGGISSSKGCKGYPDFRELGRLPIISRVDVKYVFTDRSHMIVHHAIFASSRSPGERLPRVLLALCGLVLIGGCELTDTNENALGISFTTASDRYVIAVIDAEPRILSFDIVSTVRNDGSESIQLTGCQVPNRPVLQKNVAGKWTTVYSVAETECFSPPFVVEEDESHTDTLKVQTPLDPDISLGARWEGGIPVDGTYRLLRNVFARGSPLVLLNEENRVSEMFEIRIFFE